MFSGPGLLAPGTLFLEREPKMFLQESRNHSHHFLVLLEREAPLLDTTTLDLRKKLIILPFPWCSSLPVPGDLVTGFFLT